ncbi:putative transposase [Wolbachia endosymbiont of Cylisticus convexus]|nr:putative transposase [Wolbachia endosymbiont of Cylisticus convexus]
MKEKPWIIDGYCNSEIFEAYIENRLVPILKPDHSRQCELS